jgi:hypothetical protein
MELRHVRRRLGALTVVTALTGAVLAAPAASEEGRGVVSSSTAGVTAQDEDGIEPRDLDAACPQARLPEGGFPDAQEPFTRAIDCLVWYEVTQGRADGSYGISAPVTRGQMALFLYRLLEYNLGGEPVPGADVQHDFDDVPAQAELTAAVNALSSRELADFLDLEDPAVRGYADDTFRPGQRVQRDQMASFVARVFEGLLTVYDGRIVRQGSCPFGDVSFDNVHRESINTVCGFGIATGTSDTTYAPARAVTRGQMAAFLTRTQDLLADEPFHALLPDQSVVVVDQDDCAAADVHCTIQAGVDAAQSPTDRVLVAASDDLYVEDVDLGSDGVELFGVPVPGEHGQQHVPAVEGSLRASGTERLLIGRIGILPDAATTGVTVEAAGIVALTAVIVEHSFDGGGIGIDITADEATLDAVAVRRSDVSAMLDVAGGDVRGGSFTQADEAFLVDVRDGLDLREILERTGPGLSNFFSPEPEIGEHGGSPAIVPAG